MSHHKLIPADYNNWQQQQQQQRQNLTWTKPMQQQQPDNAQVKRIIRALHHNNASTQTSVATFVFLVENSVNLVTYWPSSPHLVPCDWFLFPLTEQQLRWIKFQSLDAARAFFEGVIFTIPQSTWAGVSHRWFERMTKCINAGGEFIEKLDQSACRSVFNESFGYGLTEPPSCYKLKTLSLVRVS